MTKSMSRIAAGVVVALVHQLSLAQQVSCGLGPAPGTPDIAKIEQQRRELGYLLVCDANLERYRFDLQVADDNAVTRKLSFTPGGLAGSGFTALAFIGSIADAFGDRGAAMYRRVFRGSNGEVITFQEFSLAGGAGIKLHRSDGMVRVRGTDGQLTIVQSPAGKGISILVWQEGLVFYEVTIDRGVDHNRSKERLIALAESLPRNR